MKSYHVIYTSSQRLLSGGNGFGIRTATEGIPKEYLQHVLSCVTSNIFNSNVDDCKVPSSSDLIADGRSIRNVPPRYFYLQETVNGKPLYIVGRNVYLGFTEAFYFKMPDGSISGKSGRTGNFLLDLYLFEDRPSRQVFQLLYEDPDLGQSRFIPTDASPLTTNLEMAELASGEPKELPIEDFAYACNQPLFDDEKAINLLFSIIEARLTEPEHKNVVIKCDWKITHKIIADVMSLLPDELVGCFTFSTNYTGNGYSVPAEVNFTNQYYATQYLGKDLFVDLTETIVDTKESVAFRQIIKNAVNSGDLETVRSLVGWMLSPSYKDVRMMKPHTNGTLFLYTQQPENFTLHQLHEDEKEDQQLLNALNKLILENPSKYQNPFASQLNNALTNAISALEPENIDLTAQLIENIEIYRKYISITDRIVNPYKAQIEDVLMSNPVRTIQKIKNITLVRKYTNDLAKGHESPELASYIFDMVVEQPPKTLLEANQLILKYKGKNPEVLKLMNIQFDKVFSGIFDSVVREAANCTNKAELANRLDYQLLDLMENANSNESYKRLEQLFNILNDQFKVDDYNFKEVLQLLLRIGMIDGKIGQDIKSKLFHQTSNIPSHIKTLKEVWHMDTKLIIKEVASINSLDRNSQHSYIKEALEESRYQIEEVLSIMEEFKFTDNEKELFFSKSANYKSVYASYRRKNIISSIFGCFLKLFKGKSKDTDKQQPIRQQSIVRPKHNEQNVQRVTQQSNLQHNQGQGKPQFDRSDPAYYKNIIYEILSDNTLKKNIELFLKNPNISVSNQKVKEYGNLIIYLYEEEKKTGKKVDEIKAFRKVLDEREDNKESHFKNNLTTFLAFFLLSFGAIHASAASQNVRHNAYGDINENSKCYVVKSKVLNVRTSPSLYKGSRKKTKRNDNVGFKLNQGDTVFVNIIIQPKNADGVSWIEFRHDGTAYYTDITKLLEISNPYIKAKSEVQNKAQSDGFIGWLQNAAPTILLVITILIFVFSFFVNTPDKDSLQGEARDDTGMRPMFMYSLRPYKFFSGLSLRLLIALVASVVLMLTVGGAVWGLLWIVKILLWALIIIGWIFVILGIIGFFGAPVLILFGIVGVIIVCFQDTLESFGNRCVETGMEFFNALNIWGVISDLVQNYWLHALVISMIPIVIFLIAAAIMIIVAWCLRGYEAFTTHHYNVKHPCPWCKESSEPAEYYDEDPGKGRYVLPTKLRPGIYGLLHITHPITGFEMPTLIANGRDKMLRKCPHCHKFVNFETGTEKHIGFIGMPESGKTTLLCSIIGEMKRRDSNMHFTDLKDNIAKDFADCVDYYKLHGQLDDDHLPKKTQKALKSSVQCILPRTNSSMPYHIYFDDVAGELFTSIGNDQDLLLFAKTVENIIFIVDPMTMDLDMEDVSDSMKKWLDQPEISMMRQRDMQDGLMACDSIYNVLSKNGRDLSDINFTFALTKSDLGYLNGTDPNSPNELKRFMIEEMGLPNLIGKTKGYRSVNYVAVSVYEKNNKGVITLCDNLYQQLKLE